MFLRYQTVIHDDPPDRWKEPSFKRFLCTGLGRTVLKTDGKTQKLGSYHQCYRLDGKLVAVGVLDLLPHAVSSVYLLSVTPWGWTCPADSVQLRSRLQPLGLGQTERSARDCFSRRRRLSVLLYG